MTVPFDDLPDDLDLGEHPVVDDPAPPDEPEDADGAEDADDDG